jgi:transcriptional regulator with XRE-family HTH domain
MAFGEKSQQLRQAKGWTQRELSEASGVPLPTIRCYEINARAPSLHQAQLLAAALGCSLDVFPHEPAKPRPNRKRKE